MNDDTDILVVGTGYLGWKVAELGVASGATVHATSRRPDRFGTFRRAGFHPVQFDWTDRRTLSALPLDQLRGGARVLVSVSYDRNSQLDRHSSQVGGLQNLLDVLPDDVRLCYISTTGVYDQTDGSWVDETSPTRPTRPGGQAHLRGEALLHARRPEATYHVLRLAGLYGPGRVPRAADVISGRPIASPGDGYLNLIHVADAAQAVMASWQRLRQRPPEFAGAQSRLYLVADDCPVRRAEFYRQIARQCGADPPRFENASDRDAASTRRDSNKRIWNRKFRRQLLTTLEFPDYRRGLADVLDRPLE